MAMKMWPEHYESLRATIFKFLEEHPEVDVSDTSSMRLRWDIYWASGGAFSNAQEYQYLDDNNIDTALRSILAEYRERGVFATPDMPEELSDNFTPEMDGEIPPVKNIKVAKKRKRKSSGSTGIGVFR